MQNFELILTGFGIVIGVLAMLWAVTALVAKILNRPVKPSPSNSSASAGAAPSADIASVPETDGIPADHLAVVVAAVAESFDAPQRIVSVTGPYAHVSAWTQQGLFEHIAPFPFLAEFRFAAAPD